MTPVALVTGANRGIGLEVVRQLADNGHTVLLASRNAQRGHQAAEPLVASGLDVTPVRLDVADPVEAAKLATDIDVGHGRLDVLVNNAAVDYDTDQRAVEADLDRIKAALEVNLYGAWATTMAMLPLLRRSSAPRIVNVSSGGGALTDMGGGTPGYRTSKVALNALTRMLASELQPDGVLVNSICPGWVATDMGGPGGRPVHDGAAGIVWAATLPDDGPTGGFHRDQRPIPW